MLNLQEMPRTVQYDKSSPLLFLILTICRVYEVCRADIPIRRVYEVCKADIPIRRVHEVCRADIPIRHVYEVCRATAMLLG